MQSLGKLTRYTCGNNLRGVTEFGLHGFKQIQISSVRRKWNAATSSPVSKEMKVVTTQAGPAIQKVERPKKEVIINTKYDKCSDPMYEHLLWSSELDVFQTVKRGKVWLEKVYARKMAVERELRDRQLSATEDAVPVALEYLYGGSNIVQRDKQVEHEVTMEAETTPYLDNMSQEATVDTDQVKTGRWSFSQAEEEVRRKEYPYSVYQNIHEPLVGQNEKLQIEAGEPPAEPDVGRRLGRGRGNRRRRSATDRRHADTAAADSLQPEFDVIGNDFLNPEIRKVFNDDYLFKYGTPNPDIKSSGVPCGGCGAELNCIDEKIPGYIPSQIFESKKKEQLASTLCQRCYFIKEYNIALKVSVAPEDYPKTIQHIKDKSALILLVVDITDFPGSVWPDILDLLGTNKKFILVANKLDLILPDSSRYVKNIANIITESFLQKCKKSDTEHIPTFVSSVCVSARTGHNIEVLVDKIFRFWRFNNNSLPGDIYIVGCTNVGKSSIFNSLIDSDLCKIRAVDLVSRAMTSPVPGTTLDLLKFPVTRPEPNIINDRIKRLQQYKSSFSEKEKERLENLQKYKKIEYAIPSHFSVTHTLKNALKERLPGGGYLSSLEVEQGSQDQDLPQVLDPDSQYFRDGKWCYDSPGTVCPDQVINLLTSEEISKALAVEPLVPRTVLLRQGHSLIIGGLARLDFVSGVKGDGEPKSELHPIRATVFCSSRLPVNVLETVGVDDFLANPLAWKLTQVPSGSLERMQEFPALLGKQVHTTGAAWNLGCRDIVLSSAGWVMITSRHKEKSKFIAYTPGGKGIATRKPFLPHSINQKGKRILGTPTYRNDRLYLDPVLME